MSKFQIESKGGVILGIYEGATKQQALDAMLDDAGRSGDPTVDGTVDSYLFTEVETSQGTKLLD